MGEPPGAAIPLPGDRVVRCHANFLASVRAVASHRPGARFEGHPGLLRAAAPGAPPDYNGLFLTEPPTDPGEELRRTEHLLRSARVERWRIVAESGVAEHLGRRPEAMGLTSRRELPGLWMSAPTEEPTAFPQGLEIREPSIGGEWSEFVATGIMGFGGPRPARPPIELPYELTRQYRTFWGLFEGEPAGTSVAFSHSGVTGIFFVATLPKFRGRGIGMAMTRRAADVARERGDSDVFLQASAMGDPVYRRMGFREIVRYIEWSV